MTRNDPSNPATPIVYVIDDDISVRESLELLIRGAGWQAAIFARAQDFLCQPPRLAPHCLVLDVSLPDINGLELQQRIAADRTDMPIIFMTGYGDVAMAVRAMKGGAVEFLTKPLRAETLLSVIGSALARSQVLRDRASELQALRACYTSLSRREREVMALVVSGRLNKQIGSDLDISEITVKAHRGQAMRKMHAYSLAELVGMAAKLGIAAESNGRTSQDAMQGRHRSASGDRGQEIRRSFKTATVGAGYQVPHG